MVVGDGIVVVVEVDDVVDGSVVVVVVEVVVVVDAFTMTEPKSWICRSENDARVLYPETVR